MAAAGAAGLANPARDVTEEEMLEETGISFVIPGGAQEVSYTIIEIGDAEAISEAQFIMDGIWYCCRMQPGAAPGDISGMHYDWMAEEAVALPYTEAEVRYNEGHAGVILWYSDVMGLNCSVSMDVGATVNALVTVAELNAAWQTQEAEGDRMAMQCKAEGNSVLVVHLPANPTTGYSWTFETDETLLACQSEEYIPDENPEDLVGVGGMYIATFAPTMNGAGAVTLTFHYAREWEMDAPVETFAFDLWICEAGTLTVEGEE